MKNSSYNCNFKEYNSPEELSLPDQKLISEAHGFLSLAYAPYSKFNVAAAILLENGQVIPGANQENSSFPLCLCAERVALHHAAMRFPDMKVVAMAITAHNEHRDDLGPIPPCGACRQVIAEYEKKLDCNIRLILKGDLDKVLLFDSIKELLPLGFDGNYLGRSI